MRILYLGNISSEFGRTRTAHETLAPLLNDLVPVDSMSGASKGWLRFLHIFFNLSFSFRYQLILVDTYSSRSFYYSVIARLFAKLYKRDYILILHGGDLPKLVEQKGFKHINTFKDARMLISPGYYLTNYFNNLGLSVKQIPNVLNTEKINFRKREKIQPKILWVRSLEKHYNPELAISIVKKLRQKGYPFTITMVGPERDYEFEDLAKKSDSFIEFTGLLCRTKWLKMAEDYDLFLNTSSVDNYPGTIIEAMALGMVVCSTSVGDIPSMLGKGKRGFLVDGSNSSDFVSIIESMYLDPSKLEGLSASARAFAERHNWRVIKEDWVELIKPYA